LIHFYKRTKNVANPQLKSFAHKEMIK